MSTRVKVWFESLPFVTRCAATAAHASASRLISWLRIRNCRPMPKEKAGFDRLHGARRVVLVVCVGIYLAGALIGFDDYGKICLSADRVLWHGEGNRPTTRCNLHFIFTFCYNELPAAVKPLIEMCAKAHPAGERPALPGA